MKYKLKIILLFILFLQNCKSLEAQPGYILLGKYDYCLFSLKNKDVTALYKLSFYKENFFLFTRSRIIDHSNLDNKDGFFFVKENDTMLIHTYLPHENNYYIKGLEFKKGSYFLKFNNRIELEEINGLDIEALECLQNVVLEDYKHKDRYDVFFKDLKFTVIDLTDTLNTQLEPIKKEDFEDMDFSFYFDNVERFWDEYAIYIDTVISVSGSDTVIKTSRYDNYLVTFKKTEKEIIPIFDSYTAMYNEILFYNKSFCLFQIDLFRYPKNQFLFVNENDTMVVYTYLFTSDNYYIKDLEFKKGSYFLKINDYKKLYRRIAGSDSKTPKKLQTTLFKEEYSYYDKKNIYFKDFAFKVIDLTDTSNIQLVPMSGSEFWSGDFKIKIE
jgi:hypothetical protein